MADFHLKPGDSVRFTKTIGESDVYLFAGITGDLAPNHVDEEFMRRTPYGRRIAHGVLIVGFMSTCSSLIVEQNKAISADETPVSLGYDKIRFLGAACIGDTVTVTYTVKSIDTERRRSNAAIVVTNQHGEQIAVAEHILKWVRNR